MLYFIKLAYNTFLLPPGIFIILFFLLGVYLFRYSRKAAGILLAANLLFYLCTTAWVGDALIGFLERKHTPPAKIEGDVIVMLGGGTRKGTPNVFGEGHLSGYAANRLLTCAQLYRLLDVPIIVSGGQVYEDSANEADIARTVLTGLGIPEERIIMEQSSLNTTQNARYTAEILKVHGFQRPILVTSAFHMERALRQFEKVGLKPVPYPTDYQSDFEKKLQLKDFWPSADALHKVSLALKEYIGILAARWY